MKNAPNVPVLMYHHITPAGGMIAATPEVFEAQIAALARAGYQSLSADQFAAYLAGAAVPEKSVLITFDDGYLNNWVHAHPILAKHGMRAVIFLITGLIGDGPARACSGQGLPLPADVDHDASKRLIAEGRADEVMLRWSEVQAMRQAGTFEFHSHTHTHTRWDKVCGADLSANRQHIAQELADSRATLIQRLGNVSDHLCWPQGYFDVDYVQAAHAAGFRHLYTTDPLGQNRPGSNPAHIYRFAVRNRAGTWLTRRIWQSRGPVIGPLFHAWKGFKKRLRRRA
ncbi:polysaccharide deacetylase family protein [Bordetella holmesii]|uniref:Polysaccharide deacetylase n=2 Tax=Bordetella holmesii TaxID=35814 RepID=A0A158M618_9BORD|nr:polysaccharide deacetylase family protein [Bordetella holmesii]AHV91758.1 polysaccharide deacetylase family protein [Bordetella holmesii ATCC 51541]AIT27211.1 polysaccharide deacetylase family protein [Bordetella holmesii 44057]EWM43854.1 polysaccharide deacetylase family protein [Bordetella holmesii 41130]EWM47794.1 polysaccharide deacetylase family protein [Bordetella holmesii 35009]EWM51961.1 polysaccharide deacetylase family protein [Bordetella holmesii 70147]